MFSEKQLVEIARLVDPVGAKGYAKARGWISIDTKMPIYLLGHPSYQYRQLQIPKETESSDYAETMLDVAYRLQSIENRPIDQILEDLLEPEADTLRYRVISASTEQGTLSLEEAIALFDGAKKTLLAAACSIKEPQLHHPRMSRNEAQQLLKACRVGQTEYGSFVVKLICPLHAVDAETIKFTEPFTRKATRQVMESVHSMVTAIDNDKVEQFLRNNTENKQVSANFCGALLSMRSEVENSKLEFGAHWAPTLPEKTSTSRVLMKRQHFRAIETIYRQLRSTREEDTPTTLVGTVEELRGELDDSGHRAGTVTLSVIFEDELIKAQVALPAVDHTKAVRAYEKGLQIYLKGKLVRSSRSARIVDPEDFRVIEYAESTDSKPQG